MVYKNLDEALDPVGKADADIDNDGDSDSSDKYLKTRRKAIGKAIEKVKESYELEEAERKTVTIGTSKVTIDKDGGLIITQNVPGEGRVMIILEPKEVAQLKKLL